MQCILIIGTNLIMATSSLSSNWSMSFYEPHFCSFVLSDSLRHVTGSSWLSSYQASRKYYIYFLLYRSRKLGNAAYNTICTSLHRKSIRQSSCWFLLERGLVIEVRDVLGICGVPNLNVIRSKISLMSSPRDVQQYTASTLLRNE